MAPRRLGIDDHAGGLRDYIRVTVDGDALRDVVAYDCDEGWALVLNHDDRGERVVRGGDYLAHPVFGYVRAEVLQ